MSRASFILLIFSLLLLFQPVTNIKAGTLPRGEDWSYDIYVSSKEYEYTRVQFNNTPEFSYFSNEITVMEGTKVTVEPTLFTMVTVVYPPEYYWTCQADITYENDESSKTVSQDIGIFAIQKPESDGDWNSFINDYSSNNDDTHYAKAEKNEEEVTLEDASEYYYSIMKYDLEKGWLSYYYHNRSDVNGNIFLELEIQEYNFQIVNGFAFFPLIIVLPCLSAVIVNRKKPEVKNN